MSAAVAQYRGLQAKARDLYDFDESEVNELGYRLLKIKKGAEGLQVFQLNVESYPNSSNAYDSLAEAHMISGDREGAIQSYRTSLKLATQNANASPVCEM